jgi:hypothetical protein
MRTAAVLSLMLLAAAPAFADQVSTSRENPYSRLFPARELPKQAIEEKRRPTRALKSRIVCGMTVIEAPPFFDQKMKIDPPESPNVRYTIRAVEPPVCK